MASPSASESGSGSGQGQERENTADRFGIVLSPRSRLVIKRLIYAGQERIDCRAWWIDDAGELRPTRRGFSVPLAGARETLALLARKLEQTGPD